MRDLLEHTTRLRVGLRSRHLGTSPRRPSSYLAHVALIRWDARVLGRATVAAVLALGLAWVVTAVTDEGGVSWTDRAARVLPIGPACAAVGAWAALAPVVARGEALALQALGRSRSQIAAPAAAGGALVALAVALAIAAAPIAGVSAFFPKAAAAAAWSWQGGSFVDRALGLRVDATGTPVSIAREPEAEAPRIPVGGRAAAALAMGLAGLALPLLVAHTVLSRRPRSASSYRNKRQRRDDTVAAVATVVAVAASLVLFQAASAGRASALLGVLPPAALLAFALERYRALP